MIYKRACRFILSALAVLVLFAGAVAARAGDARTAPPDAPTVGTALNDADGGARIEFTRTLSGTHVKKGAEVTVIYRVRNSGEAPLSDLVVRDDLCGVVGELAVLAPGERESFVKKIKIQKTSISRPTVSYRWEGSQTLSEPLKAATIYLANERLEYQLAADRVSIAPGELVTLRLSLNNLGNVTYRDIKISDAALGALGVITEALKPGEEYTFVKTVSLKSTTTFQFDITAKSGSGDEIVESSNMLTVSVSPVVENISISVSAQAKPKYLPAPGEATFVITIENKGDADIRNAVLLEQNLGELKNLAVLAPGTTTVEYPREVLEDGTYTFMVQVTDAKDGHMTFLSDAISVDVDENGGERVPEQQKTVGADISRFVGGSNQLNPYKYYEEMILWALLVVSVLLLALMCVYIGKHRKKRRRKRSKAGKYANSDNPDFTDTKPHVPIGKK